MTEKQIETEWGILIALFNATVQQTNMLTGQPQREAKQIFNRWTKEGHRLMKVIESMSNEDDIEEVTELIENSVHKLRK